MLYWSQIPHRGNCQQERAISLILNASWQVGKTSRGWNNVTNSWNNLSITLFGISLLSFTEYFYILYSYTFFSLWCFFQYYFVSKNGLLLQGSFGEILRASWRGTPVAVKRILPSLSDDRLVTWVYYLHYALDIHYVHLAVSFSFKLIWL